MKFPNFKCLGMATAIILSSGGYASGAVVFQDNFDTQADWFPPQPAVTCECLSGACPSIACPTPLPTGYVAYRIAEPVSCSVAGKNTLNIDATHHTGPAGKGFTYWNEPCQSQSGSWGSDGLLHIKLADPGYTDLYVRFYIKFQPGWQWNANLATDNHNPMQKFFRVSHYWGGNDFNGFNFQAGGSHYPFLIGQGAKFNSGAANYAYDAVYKYQTALHTATANPPHAEEQVFYFGTGNYAGTGTNFWDAGQAGDGNWHSWEFRVKMNSAIGTPDGIHEFWQDGVKITSVTDLAWADTGTPALTGWNSVMIGGNNHNYYPGGGEQWYALDDLVISTTYIGPKTVPVGGFTQANAIPASQVSQAADGSGKVTIKFKALDSVLNNPVTLSNFEFSTDGGATWTAPANGSASAAFSSGWTGSYQADRYTVMNGASAEWSGARTYSFTVNTKHADLAGLNHYDGNAMFRFFINNGAPSSSNDPVKTDAVRIDNVAPGKSNTPTFN